MSFSSVKNINILVDAGVPESQAKAQVQVLENFRESELATKRDLKELELRLTLRLGGMIVAGVLILAALIKL